jgi:hypothetical protein
MYSDKWSKGTDPISDKFVPASDCICQERISRCLSYVSEILEKVIAEKTGAENPPKKSIQSQSNLPAEPCSARVQKQKTPKPNRPGTERRSASPSPIVGIGSTVKLLELDTHETSLVKLIQSHSQTRYKTMGYKTKKYAEVYQTSDADGSTTISDVSPLGKAILFKRVGDVVEFSVNGKTIRYKILAIN